MDIRLTSSGCTEVRLGDIKKFEERHVHIVTTKDELISVYENEDGSIDVRSPLKIRVVKTEK